MGCAASVNSENKPVADEGFSKASNGRAHANGNENKDPNGYNKAAPKPVVVDGKTVPVQIAHRPSLVRGEVTHATPSQHPIAFDPRKKKKKRDRIL